MSQTNKIEARVYPQNSDEVLEFEVNYISFVTEETYGIPAILSDASIKTEGLPVRILYVNPSNIAALEAIRIA